MRLKKTLLIILASLFCFLHLSYADTLDTKLSRDKISLGETLTISYTLNSQSNNTSPDFSAFEKDFRILATNYGKSINIVNGVTNTQTFWELTLEPKRAGEIDIPEIHFGNAKSALGKLIVEHTKSIDQSVNQTVAAKPDSSTFVEAEISTAAPYIQSQVVYTFKLFYQSQLENPRIEIPQIKDAMLVQLDNGKHYQTTIKGKPFLVVEKSFAYFPQKTGKISLPASHFSALTYDLNSMNDPFNLIPTKNLSLVTQAFTLDVRDIPANFQGTTWLPAKNISLTEKWSVEPDQWELGNPATRTITVEANGLRADQIPDLVIDQMPGMNTYVDPPKRSNIIKGNSLTGILEQKVTYIPNVSQSFTIPTIKLNWWNLQTNDNAVSQLNSISLKIKGGINKAAPLSPNLTPVSAGTDTSNIFPIQSVKNPFYLSIWFWMTIFLFIGWIITLYLILRKRSPKKINLNSPPERHSTELSEERFKQACEQGDVTMAQQYLLSWAKKEWPDTPLNLEKLGEQSCDLDFKTALENLEQAIYAKNVSPWNGQSLLNAYQKVKKQKRSSFSITKHAIDPLPPLYP